jgi:hypothetical protein
VIPDKEKLDYAETSEKVLNVEELVFAEKREMISDKQTLFMQSERK